MHIDKPELYQLTAQRINALIEGESDWFAVLSTVVCELHNSFDYFHWTGFYRTTEPNLLKVGPYMGGHGCLAIPFSRGVCGAAAASQETQLVPDVDALPYHIACSSSTKSEIVVPLISKGETIAVLDVDSDNPDAFDQHDQLGLELICNKLVEHFEAS